LKKYCVLSIALLVLALIIVPVVTGCGGSTTTTAPPATTATTTATTAAPSTTATTAAPTTTASAPASTETTAAPTTTTAAAAAYDITKIVAAIQVDSAAAGLVPEKYKSAAVKVGSDAPYPPWEMFVGETDQFTGFDYDLAQAIGAKLGIKFEFVQSKFDAIVIGIQAGNFDVAMSSMYDNLTRRKTLDFVDYAKDGTGMLVAKGNPNGIKSFNDLAGKNVGCEKGTTQADALTQLNEAFKTQGIKEINVQQFPDQPAALLAVSSGNVVCDLTDSSTGGYIAAQSPDKYEIVMDPNPPEGWETQPDGIGVLKSNTGLRDAIQKALQALMDDGTYKTILDHYGIQAWPSATVNAGQEE
jgi:polar amino acid transport system substrate-binding protein